MSKLEISFLNWRYFIWRYFQFITFLRVVVVEAGLGEVCWLLLLLSTFTDDWWSIKPVYFTVILRDSPFFITFRAPTPPFIFVLASLWRHTPEVETKGLLQYIPKCYAVLQMSWICHQIWINLKHSYYICHVIIHTLCICINMVIVPHWVIKRKGAHVFYDNDFMWLYTIPGNWEMYNACTKCLYFSCGNWGLAGHK